MSVPLTAPTPLPEDTKCFQSLLDNFNHTLRAAGALSSQSNAHPSCQKSDSKCTAPGKKRKEGKKLGESIILMAHGIGCLLALSYENRFPSDVERLILLDNGIRRTYLLSELGWILAYEGFFAAIYWMHNHLSTWLATVILRLTLLIVLVLSYLSHKSDNRLVENMSIIMRLDGASCYLYYSLFLSRIQGCYPQVLYPHCPLLFMVSNQLSVGQCDDS